MTAKKTTESNEIAVARRVQDSELLKIGESGNAFKDAFELAEQMYGEVAYASEVLGNGMAILENKALLVGKAFIALQWRFHDGDFGMFVSVNIITAEPIEGQQKFVLNDGSSGICGQLHAYETDTGRDGGLAVRHGLRASDYATCKGCDKPRPAKIEVCANTLNNGSVCGDTSTERGSGTTYYLDLTQ